MSIGTEGSSSREENEGSVASRAQEVPSRKNFLKLGGAGLVAAALFATQGTACAQTSEPHKTYGVDSIAALRDVTPVSDQRITALGYHSPGDGGGGLFRYVGNRSLTDNGGTVVDSYDGAGQWLRVFEGAINARWFGARGDGAADDRVPIQAALDTSGNGDSVYLPNGSYKISDALALDEHGVTLDFEGTLGPHGTYSGYLLRLGAATGNDRALTSDEYTNLPAINIRGLTLNCLDQCKGFTATRLDHFLWQNVKIQRHLGNAFKCSTLREADIVNMTIVKGNSGPEPNFWIADELDADETNALRVHGLTVVYSGGQALKIGPSAYGEGRSRQISFLGMQLHYLDGSLSYASVDDSIKLIELLKTNNVSFHGGNIRLGAECQGTLISLGDATHSALDTAFYGTVMWGEGKGATGIDAVNAQDTRVFGALPNMANGTSINDPNANITEQPSKLDTDARESSSPLSSYPLGQSTMLVNPSSAGWPVPTAAHDVVTFRTSATAGHQLVFARIGNAVHKRGWNSEEDAWQGWVEVANGGGRVSLPAGTGVSTTETSFSDVTGLSFTMAEDAAYRFRAVVIFDAAETTTGSRWSVNSGVTAERISFHTTTPPPSGSTPVTTYHTAYDGAATATTGTPSPTNNLVVIEGAVVNGGSAGVFAVRFASEVSGSAITAQVGSSLEMTRL